MNRYFISYTYMDRDGSKGAGNTETEYISQILNINDLSKIADSITKDSRVKGRIVVINNFIKFED